MDISNLENSLSWRKLQWNPRKKRYESVAFAIYGEIPRNLQEEADGILQFVEQRLSDLHDQISEQTLSLYTAANHDGWNDKRQEMELVLPRGKRTSHHIHQLLVAACLLQHPFEASLRELALEKSYQKQYTGNWKKLQSLVEVSYSRTLMLQLLLETQTSRAIMGWLPSAINELVKEVFYRVKIQSPPVRQTNQIGVGYRDKGARTLDHKKIIEQYHTGENPEIFNFDTIAYKRNSLMNFLTFRSIKLKPRKLKSKKEVKQNE